MIMHIDGNSFYASCERVFRPDISKSPIAVLTNNDGIIISLNNECKALGYKRGDVFYKVKYQMERQGVKAFSSNYTLYADISNRMNLIYNRLAPEVEIYSIDESFLYFPDWTNCDYIELAKEVKTIVTRDTGIPVSVGIAPNKTLSKLCNKLAKKRGGICSWQELNQDEELAAYPVEDIWGIGHSKTKTLKSHGIHTALDLKNFPLDKASKHLTITGYKTVRELNGISIIDKIEDTPSQVISVSRSFQSPVYKLTDIITALADYTQEAVKRIREEHLSCKYITVYLTTNIHSEGEQYFNQQSAELTYPSSSLTEITAAANGLIKSIFRPNYKYRKVMIALTGLENENTPQLDLFSLNANKETNDSLMKAFDTINGKYGRGTLKLACGLGKAEETRLKRDYLSPCYTTKIADIPEAY